MCTGWGDHFAMFNDATKIEVGLPTVSKHADSQKHSQRDNAWEKYDIEADRSVNEKLPFIATAPKVRHPRSLGQQHQRNWRLYRRSIPLELAAKGDRSLAIMGQIHTVQTPLVSEMQSFWTILYLLGELDVPDSDTMSKEVAEWNAWTRKRYLSQGQKFPYSLYDFLPVSRPGLIACSGTFTDETSSTLTPCAKTSASTRAARQTRGQSYSRLTNRRISPASSTSTWSIGSASSSSNNRRQRLVSRKILPASRTSLVRYGR